MREKLTSILEYQFFNAEIGERTYSFSVLEVVIILFIIGITRAAIWLIQRALDNRVQRKRIDPGKAYAITQILKYLLWTISIIYCLDYLGVKITVLLAGSTALFVGLGLGLQDAFKDFVSGFIILMERTVTVGDIVEVDGIIGKVLEVGLRTTLVQTRDDIYMIIPNQKLTNEHVINWSQSKKVTRFSIGVGVAYGSDTRLVEKLLLDAVNEHKMISKTPAPTVQFIDFGNSSLDFKIFFYSANLFRIEAVKSDVRYIIDQKFRENNITIPFPQRDLWVRDYPRTGSPLEPESKENNE
ncbi:mechanosensitive ion channel family protein [Phaeocystidibacter marisrubri]|uniref:Mechanosensitive ion channel n=1 Tax=Phaeocystidibacter marisrubri TaxID=1577780 RepID=A0A6L3ZHV6_9FLAO|nr:mechanosensitive ion channel domain-containing protein [Phaeocystidibacter marisrubri]KAB2817065.1 mechanosensitive ion channel [Phaeocystidibacter marisrubri]GGH76999.1 hypothetical protein GCM10011318_26110 [Phaeocystidibacter marisrubri]